MNLKEAEEVALRIVEETGMDALIVPLERGDVFAVRVVNPCWFLWSPNEFATWERRARHRRAVVTYRARAAAQKG